MTRTLNSATILPKVTGTYLLIGRVWSNEQTGPCSVFVDNDVLRDLSSLAPTTAGLLEEANLVGLLTDVNRFPVLGYLDDFLSKGNGVGPAGHLLAPCDLQPIKAAGVTFTESILERLIEEQAKGEPGKAEDIRNRLSPIIGENLQGVEVGSKEAAEVKSLLQDLGLWSQYLEVALGPDAEIFTKSPPMAAVGVGHEIGINRESDWNNPEPEIVLAVSSNGKIVGATLGNDVNLRDFEGRSALLLNIAKDNNASCAIGPFIRLLDDKFNVNDLEKIDIELRVTGEDGFEVSGVSQMCKISRSPSELVRQTLNHNHQYPDGVMLFLGTMFVPTRDRHGLGSGFSHKIGDQVEISTPELGSLINWVNYCDQIEPWSFGSLALFRNLAGRNLS